MQQNSPTESCIKQRVKDRQTANAVIRIVAELRVSIPPCFRAAKFSHIDVNVEKCNTSLFCMAPQSNALTVTKDSCLDSMPGVWMDFSLTKDSSIIGGGGLFRFIEATPWELYGWDRTDTGLLATGPATGGGGGGGGAASSFAAHKQNSFKLNAFSFIVLSIAAKSMSGSPSPRNGSKNKEKMTFIKSSCKLKIE